MTRKPKNDPAAHNPEDDEDEDEGGEEGQVSRALRERAILMLSGPVREQHLGVCHELLAYHYRQDFNDPITLLINSPGGSCEIGWAIVDVMNFIRLPVHTVCIGLAASMAADIFANGDHRVMGEHSTLMIHQHSSISAGSHSKLIATLKGDEIEHNRRLRHYLTNSVYESIEEVEEHLLNIRGEDLYLAPEECLVHGLTDEIAASNKKTKRRKRPAVGPELLGKTVELIKPGQLRDGTNSRANNTTRSKARNRK